MASLGTSGRGAKRPVRIAQACFLLLGIVSLVVTLVVVDTLTLEWVVVGAFVVVLLTVELGAPWYDRPWWQTRAGLVVLAGFVLYLLVLFRVV